MGECVDRSDLDGQGDQFDVGGIAAGGRYPLGPVAIDPVGVQCDAANGLDGVGGEAAVDGLGEVGQLLRAAIATRWEPL